MRTGRLEWVRQQLAAVQTLSHIGMLNPAVGIAQGRATKAWGATPAGALAAAAHLLPAETALIDEAGRLSFGEVDALSSALANALVDRGVGAGDRVAMLCRNSRWFVIAATALSKIGAATLYLNTGFAGPQVVEVLEREGATTVIYDEVFADLIETHLTHLDLVVTDADATSARVGAADLLAHASRRRPDPPERPGPQIILTSGTTGTPKGAKRPNPRGLVAVTGMFQRIPWRRGDVHLVAAPMFHALGNGGFQIAVQFGQTCVTRCRFDPEDALATIDAHGVTGMTVVPVMLQRILDLGEETIRRYDTSSLRIVHCSGAALPGSLATRWMDRFGDNLYNVFASTEVGAATIANPKDMRSAPGTAGQPVPGSTVRLFDDDGVDVTSTGRTGRIFVGTDLAFEGYTTGGGKEQIGNLLSIGDVGHFDDGGRLFVGGRDDDMIVSGGENVYPREVEDLLADHPAIAEVAVVGVPDEQFGQRLSAFVVLRPGATLDADAVRAHVKANLANYKAPRDIKFLSALPRNPTGKVLKRDLLPTNA
ncbi:MAG TPA: AMP-binding protein [Acidimicrobiales bacterium]|jgi:fatty-acyl-CoA synthase